MLAGEVQLANQLSLSIIVQKTRFRQTLIQYMIVAIDHLLTKCGNKLTVTKLSLKSQKNRRMFHPQENCSSAFC